MKKTINSDFMTSTKQLIRIFIITIIAFTLSYNAKAQENTVKFSGTLLESGTGAPVKQAVVSIASNGEYTNTDDEGKFSIDLPSSREKLIINFPGFYLTEFFTNGKAEAVIYLTKSEFKSEFEESVSPLGYTKLNDATNAVSLMAKNNFENTASYSFDQSMVGRVSGLNVIEHSGMPGHNSWINLRGISSIYGRNQPLVFIDGMIHEINYPDNELIEGYLLNPMDIIDIDDIVNVSVNKLGEGYLGSAGSNGLLNINTEQNRVTSASIIFKTYAGISFQPKRLEVMNSGEFKPYFTDLLESEGYSSSQINSMYPWLNGGSSADEYYRYNNDTDWQDESFKPSAFQKYYIFLKGGDDIATYNISTGYTRHGANYEDWRASRYNLRLNGKVNITKKLSVIPNTKLSLSDTYLSNMGPTSERNPIVASLQKSPLMHAHEKSELNGAVLFPYDDVGAFGISNPAVLINEALGSNRNFQLLSSVKVGYEINSNFSVSHLIGISVNNDRTNMFIPNIGVVQLDSARNSPRDMVTEFRSLQNHTTVTYKNVYDNKHHVVANAGLRTMDNSYKNNFSMDLNTPSDDFRSLGQGKYYRYLRTNGGALNELKWVSYFADGSYNYYDKYYLRASLSLDASSVFNKKNRYNFYPSVFAAWRVTSSDNISVPSWINDLKLRAAASITGNMFSTAYNLSKTTYTGRRYNDVSVVTKDYITNEDLKAEKKLSTNIGVDLSFGKKAYNVHLDYHMSSVNNLIINQSLPYNYGFTDYLDNGGKLALSGVELSGDGRWHIGEATLLIDASVTYQTSKIKSLDFINSETEFMLHDVEGAQYITSVDNPINCFYGYTTDGVIGSNDPAIGTIGPNGRPLEAGDIKFIDTNNDKVIDYLDKEIIGNPNPDLFGSVMAQLGIKKFKVSGLFTYSIGNDMYNYVATKMYGMNDYANQSSEINGNIGTTYPKLSVGDPRGNTVFSDRWIEDASYFRFKQLTVSYTTPNILTWQKEATFYLTGTNLFTLTKYTGYNPETMYQNNIFNMGIDYGKLPQATSVILGVQISL